MNKQLLLLTSILVNLRLSGSQGWCNTTECLQAASSITISVDTAVKPCDDFYDFVCGTFEKKTALSKSTKKMTSFGFTEKLIDEKILGLVSKPIEASDPRYVVLLKSIFQACMNTDAIERRALPTMKIIFKSTGGWPILEGRDWNQHRFKWTHTIYKFKKLGLFTDMFFSISVERDFTNSSKSVLKLNSPAQSFVGIMSEKDRQKYRRYLVKNAIFFGADRKTANKNVDDVINLDAAISNIIAPPESFKRKLGNNPMTIGKLQKLFPNVPSWLKFINSLLSPYKTMTDDDTVIVTDPKYFKQLKTILKNTSKRTIANFMYWKTLMSATPYLNNCVRNNFLILLKNAYGLESYPERWIECVGIVKELPIATSALYVSHLSLDKETNVAVTHIEEYVRYAMKTTLETTDWIDDNIKKKALKKLKHMDVHIGYPDQLLNPQEVDWIYKNLFVDRHKYLESMLNVTIFKNQVSRSKLIEGEYSKDWKMYAAFSAVPGTFYNYKHNSLVIPVGFLQNDIFHKNKPAFMNFGTLGTAIGHEITRGFDDYGRRFDEHGNLKDWWNQKSTEHFQTRAKCFVKQYSRIFLPEIDKKINGVSTQTTNIADNSGIKQAYLAYKKWVDYNVQELPLPGLSYTPEQLFWIFAGSMFCTKTTKKQLAAGVLVDPYSPNRQRLNVPLMNSEYFAKDFNCPVGSLMNPKKKCILW